MRDESLDPSTLEACRLGDADAFRVLVETYRRPVLSLCIALAGDDGEDLTQETFVRVHRAIHRFDPSGRASLRGWILCIARRLCQDRARVLGRRGRVAPIGDDTLDEALDPGAALDRADRDARVGRAIQALPDDQRAALALYEWEGLDYEAIAAREAVPVGTVRSRLSRARAALRAALAAVVAACRGGGARSPASSAMSAQETPMIAKLALALAAVAGAVVTVQIVRSGDSPIGGASRAPVTQAVAEPAFTSPTDHAAPAAPQHAGSPQSRAVPPAPARVAHGHDHAAGAPSPCGGDCDSAERPALPERAELDVAGAPAMGPSTAKVTIVELVDFQCPFCEKAVATIHDLAALYPDDVRIVVKNMPLPNHELARGAAIAALAAQRQNKYWEMHEMLFSNQDALDGASLAKHARTLGLDVARFERDLADPAIAATVDADFKEASAAGFQGVPSFTINGRVVVGALPLDQLRKVVDEELVKARAK
ncbi:MAG TPA: sigma-70 family RNA polymerase sigma factor [Kofleriaceae bacterium]|nr:sigma-70 family RNA polymerase sigma factor [Kofleriaceae bacterium]